MARKWCLILTSLFVAASFSGRCLADTPPSTKNAPFIETFQKNSKILIYVAAVHHSSLRYPNAAKDPVFETIEKVFSGTPPDAVIVEGVEPSDLSGFLKFSDQCAAAGYNISGKICDEPELTAHEAVRLGVPVFTGEPTNASVLAYFKAQDYGIQDLLSFYLMRNIPVQNNHTPLTKATFPAFADRILTNAQREFGTSIPFAADNFKAWYARHMPIPMSYLDITTNDTGPDSSPNATKLQKMSAVDSVMRDGSVVGVVKRTLAKHTRVLVVYGASHLVFEWSSLEAAMGVPTSSKPF